MSRLSAAVCAVLAAVSVAAIAAPESTRVIVAFKPGAGPAARAAVAAAGGNVALEIAGMNAMAVNVPARAVAGLARNPNVEYVEEDVKRYPLALTSASTGTPYQLGQLVPYGIRMVQADLLPDSYGSNRMVCIIDSGVDKTHEDLSATSSAARTTPAPATGAPTRTTTAPTSRARSRR
jgi:hypothetical protein